jgi:2-polyprenyl-3-methyl-5-hydroxy-6-metoxy-1,4-benzoquinol methylase
MLPCLLEPTRRLRLQALNDHDPTAFRSDRLPTGHFDARFSDDNLAFWVPILIDAAQIGPGLEVLDVGCGTGGFTRAIAASAGADDRL